MISLQRSNFSNGYYLNLGYVISTLHPSINSPRDLYGDVTARFSIDKKDNRVDFFDLEILGENDQDWLEEQLEYNIRQYIEPVKSLESLKDLLSKKPVMLYQTSLAAKKLLGFE